MAKGNVFGFPALQVWKRGSDGYAYGQITDVTTPGTNVTSSAYAMFDGISATLPEITRALAEFRGGSVYLGSAFMGTERLAPVVIDLANYDDTLNTLVGNGSADTTTVSGWTMSGINEQNPNPTQLGAMLTLRFQSRASGTDGDNLYLNVVMPNCTGTYTRVTAVTQNAGENPSPSRLTLALSSATRHPTGVAFGSNQGWYNNRTSMYFIVSDYPLAVTTYIADGSATTFILGYRPKYSTVTSGNTNNWTAKNGTATAATSINTSTGVVTLAAAGSASDKHVVMYPTEFTAI